MSNVAYYAIQYDVNQRGYIAYDKDAKTVDVVLPDAQRVEQVRNYLQESQAVENAVGLDTYETVDIHPLDSLENLKLALTRMWVRIGVQVDWSRPAEVNGEFKFPE